MNPTRQIFKPDFLVIPTILVEDENVQPLDCMVYGVIYWFHSLKDGVCFASNPTIAAVAHGSPRGVQNSLTNLEKRGYIKRFAGPKGRQIMPLIGFKNTPVSKTDGEIGKVVTCFYCGNSGRMGADLEEDHYIPKSRGGSDEKSNKVLACHNCNQAKGDMTGYEYIAYLKAHKVSPNDDSHETVTEDITKRGHSMSPNGDQNNNIVNKKKELRQEPQQAFNSRETRQKWYEGKDEAFQLLAFFFDKKGLWKKFDTREKVAAVAKRHLRAARRIVAAGWSQQEVEKAIAKMPEKLKDEWTLETAEKYLTK